MGEMGISSAFTFSRVPRVINCYWYEILLLSLGEVIKKYFQGKIERLKIDFALNNEEKFFKLALQLLGSFN